MRGLGHNLIPNIMGLNLHEDQPGYRRSQGIIHGAITLLAKKQNQQQQQQQKT